MHEHDGVTNSFFYSYSCSLSGLFLLFQRIVNLLCEGASLGAGGGGLLKRKLLRFFLSFFLSRWVLDDICVLLGGGRGGELVGCKRGGGRVDWN